METLKHKEEEEHSNRTGIRLMAVIFLYVVLSVAISYVTPYNKGPDEGYNMSYIEFIITQGRLPISYQEREQVGAKANWPALYHVMVAWLSGDVQVGDTDRPQIKIFWDSFRYRAIDIEADSTWYLDSEDMDPPYYGRILVLYLGRWLSILFSVLTLFFVYQIMVEILPARPRLALMAVVMLGFIPTFIFVGSVLNEDSLVSALSMLYLWMLVRIIKHPDQTFSYWVAGFAMGLSVTVKYTTAVLPLEAILVIAVVARQAGYNWQWWFKRVAVVGISSILASSWWFGWNLWYLNQVEELGWVAGLLHPLFSGGSDISLARMGNFFSGGQIGIAYLPDVVHSGTLAQWAWRTFLTFWAVFIGGEIPLYPYAYIAVGLIMGVAIFGLWRLWRLDVSARKWLLLMLFHLALAFLLPLVDFTLARRLGTTAQGRHILIPAAAAVVALLVWGLTAAVPKRLLRPVFMVVGTGLVIWTGTHVYRLATYSTPPLPLRTISQAAEWLPYPINARFGDTVELVSADILPTPDKGLVQLNLAWRSTAYINENYLLGVLMVNQQGEVVSHWTGYNGQGRLPTLAWEPGDSIFDRIALPLPALPAGDYVIYVQLFNSAGSLAVDYELTSQRVSELITGHYAEQDNILPLMSLTLKRGADVTLSENMLVSDEGLPSPVQVDFALWRTDGQAAANPTYRYPATISVITALDNISLELVDPDGKNWPATHSEANIHSFVIGERWKSGRYSIRATIKEQNISGDSEPLLVVTNWWERHFEPPEIATPAQADFANQLLFLGYDLPNNQVKAGESLPLTLYWQAQPGQPPQADFTQFNHLNNSNGQLYGGYDRRPLEYYSTLLWAAGEVVIDGYTIPVAADAPPGIYYLDVGYYITVGDSAVNLPLVVDGQATDVSSVTVGPIEVISP